MKKKYKPDVELKPAEVRPPIMILGCMRSGTTFLADKLCGHPQLLKIGLELSDVWEELTGVSIYDKCLPSQSSDYKPIHTFRFSQYLDQVIEESRSLKRALMRLKLKLTKGNGRVSYDWEAVIPVLKSTHLLNKIPFVTNVLPEVKIVFIIRDVFAQSASLKRHVEKQTEKGWSFRFPENPKECWAMSQNKEVAKETNLSIESFPLMWLRLNALALKEISKLNPAQYRVISYEKLVNHQNRTLREVFNFLDLKGKYRKEEEKILDERSNVYNTTTSGDLLTKWRDQLTKQEVSKIEMVLKSHKTDLDYISSFL